MIGLALMAMMAIFGSLGLGQHRRRHRKTLTSQFIVSNVVGQPFSTDCRRGDPDVDGVAGRRPGAQASPSQRRRHGVAAGSTRRRRGRVRDPDGAGLVRGPGAGTVAIAEPGGEDANFRIGDTVTWSSRPDIKLKVVAMYPRHPALPADYLVTPDV